jgi:hypothetical protein
MRAFTLLVAAALAVSCGTTESEPTSQIAATPTPDERCDFAPVEPTWLPWLKEGEPVPSPVRSYDEMIDRAQESWDAPDSSTGVGLTRYTLHPGSGAGEYIGADIGRVHGFLHESEGGGLVIVWNLHEQDCNYVELILTPRPELSVEEAKAELVRVAESLQPRG